MATNDGQQPGANVESLSFEDAFRQLSEMASQLESGGLSLDEATSRFELGMKLVQRCNHLLDTAELEITRLKESYHQAPPAGVPESPAPPEFDEDNDLPF
jgi:exodeoxyribonuclease VII small subunit